MSPYHQHQCPGCGVDLRSAELGHRCLGLLKIESDRLRRKNERLAKELTESKNALLKDKWVPVGERLPNDQEFVWITDGTRVTYGLFEKDYYGEGDHEWADRQTESDCWTDVTHWQPAATPEPPVKQGEEKL